MVIQRFDRTESISFYTGEQFNNLSCIKDNIKTVYRKGWITKMFKQDIARTIGKVLKANGYRKVSLSRDCVYFIKRHSEYLAFYVKCLDSRSHNRGVSVEIFFAPVQYPDDGIMSLPVGLNINILTVDNDELSDEIMIAAGEKVVAVEEKLGSYAGLVLDELKNPYFPNLRWEIYTKMLLIYKTLNEDPEIREQIKKFITKWCTSSQKNKPSTGEFVSVVLSKLPEDYFEKSGVDLDISRIKGQLLLYIEGQCELD